MVACPEEVAFNNNWIDAGRISELADSLANSGYGEYLRSLI